MGFWDRLFLVLLWITPGISDWSKYSIRTPRSKTVRQKWQITHCIHQCNFKNPIPHHSCKFNFNTRRLVYVNPYAVDLYNITYNCKIYSCSSVSQNLNWVPLTSANATEMNRVTKTWNWFKRCKSAWAHLFQNLGILVFQLCIWCKITVVRKNMLLELEKKLRNTGTHTSLKCHTIIHPVALCRGHSHWFRMPDWLLRNWFQSACVT